MIGIALPRRRWLAAVGLLVPLAIQLAPRDQADVQLSPLMTPIAPPAVAPPTGCAPFVDEIVRQPDWELHVRNSRSYGPPELGDFAIHGSGTVEWSLLDEPDRRLTLTADELARVRALNLLGCTRSRPIGFGERAFEIYRGDAPSGGAEVEGTSAMAIELEAILVAAIDRYDAASIATAGGLQIELDARPVWTERWSRGAAREHLTLSPDGTLIVTRGHHVLVDDHLDRRTLVDLHDAIIATPPADPSVDDIARGRATIGAHTLALRLQDDPTPGLGVLTSTLDDASAAE
jgi:hypothetical protein